MGIIKNEEMTLPQPTFRLRHRDHLSKKKKKEKDNEMKKVRMLCRGLEFIMEKDGPVPFFLKLIN